MARTVAIPGSIAVLQFRQLVQPLKQLGIDPARVFGRVGISEAQLLDDSARVAAGVEFGVWDAIEEISGDPMVALNIADIVAPGALGAYEYLMRNSPSLRSAIDRAARYARVIDELTQVGLIEADGLAGLRVWRLGDYPLPGLGIECIFGVLIRIVGSAPPAAHSGHQVHFVHRGAAPLAEYERRLGGPVRFGQAWNQILFPHALLDSENLGADQRLAELLESHVQRILATLPNEDPFVTRARASLAELLTRNAASLERLAELLNLSARTLRRKLEAQGTSYKDVLDEVRRELGSYYVLRTDESLDRVAQRLGFSEPSTFYRAFKRWYGTTPAQYRTGGAPRSPA